MIAVLLSILSLFALANENCDSLFEARELGLKKSQEALECYTNSYAPTDTREDQSHNLNRTSYLNFFIAEYFLDVKAKTLYSGMELAERSVLLFGTKYSLSDYRLLSPNELKLLSNALYNYGLITARYVDIMGTFEALKRMGDIKKSMLTIIRLKEESTAHYGAHRTLGIFNTKVPSIAGGDLKLAGEYLVKALESTQNSDGLSSYPVNNIAYAEWLYKNGKKTNACAQLNLVKNLGPSEARALNNDLYFESMIDVKRALELWNDYKCQ